MEKIINEAGTLHFTGERYMPEIHGNIELEHLRRYLPARQRVTGKTLIGLTSFQY